MSNINSLVVFSLDSQKYALDLYTVERVVRIVEITPLPKSPEIVLGVINVHGQVIPAVNIRKRFLLPEKEISLSDTLIIAHTSKRTVGIVVDSVLNVINLPDKEVFSMEKNLPDLEYVAGVVKLESGLLFIHNLEKFLSPAEEKDLEDAMVKVRDQK